MDLKILDYLTEGVIFITPNRKIGYINKSAFRAFKRNIGDDCFGLFSTCKSNCPLENLSEIKEENINLFNVYLL